MPDTSLNRPTSRSWVSLPGAPESQTDPRPTPLLAALIIGVALMLAGWAAHTDSITVDEPSHLVAGYTALRFGDFRLSPDHPPLARLLLALPLLAQDIVWLPADADPGSRVAWSQGDFLTLGREFFEPWNDGMKLVAASRVVALLILAALLWTTFLIARARFGGAGGLVALALVAFDPNLLAHGHLATIDVPFTLGALLTLVAAERWLTRPTRGRAVAAAASFAATALVKFSFLTLIPALLVLGIVARRNAGWRALLRTLVLSSLVLAVSTWLGIWIAYGGRFQAARGPEAAKATFHVLGDLGRPLPTTPAAAWEAVLHDPRTGVDRPGLAAPLLRFAHRHQLLPEAYLYGLAYVAKKGYNRAAYLRGQYSNEGFPSYFVWVAALKIPIPTLILLGFGLIGARRRPAAWSPFSWGLAVFALSYFGALFSSALNLGVRHLLPLLPLAALAAASACSAALLSTRIRRAGLALLLTVLFLGSLRTAPHFLGSFNGVVDWQKAHLFLAESNLDWGQDLLRLAPRLENEPQKLPIWIAQARDPPWPRALGARGSRRLFGEGRQMRPETAKGGLYVISATELVGIYRPLARPEAWRDPQLSARYEQLAEAPLAVSAPGLTTFEALRRLRLVARLATRAPDERIGRSLFLFRLSDEEVEELTRP